MRVAVLGAAGVVGSSVVESLRFDPDKRVDAIIGIAAILPPTPQPHVDWRAVALATDDLEPHFQGVDAVVHTATGAGGRSDSRHSRDSRFDPVETTRRVLEAAASAGVRHVVVRSSFAVYARVAPGHDPVDESWPTEGVAAVPFVRRALAIDRLVDDFSHAHQVVRLVRIRCGVALGPRSGGKVVERLGPLGAWLGATGRVPFLPVVDGAAVPAVHHDDLAAAFRAAVTGSGSGAYNVALDEPLDLARAADALGAHPLRVPTQLVTSGSALVGRARAAVRRGVGRSSEGWLDVASGAPRLDTSRARRELGWTPVHSLDDALRASLPASR